MIYGYCQCCTLYVKSTTKFILEELEFEHTVCRCPKLPATKPIICFCSLGTQTIDSGMTSKGLPRQTMWTKWTNSVQIHRGNEQNHQTFVPNMNLCKHSSQTNKLTTNSLPNEQSHQQWDIQGKQCVAPGTWLLHSYLWKVPKVH